MRVSTLLQNYVNCQNAKDEILRVYDTAANQQLTSPQVRRVSLKADEALKALRDGIEAMEATIEYQALDPWQK